MMNYKNTSPPKVTLVGFVFSMKCWSDGQRWGVGGDHGTITVPTSRALFAPG